MEKISVAIVTLNEEKNIGRCLSSVKEIADEIVVIDSFSTDGTKDICNREGARFIQEEWKGYVETKNFALDQCQFSLVLSLDADEALSEELKKSILEVKNNRTKDAYTFNRMTNFCGQWIKHGGWYPDKKLRLFDKNKGRWAGKDIHEFVQMSPSATTAHLNGDLLHFSFYTISEHLKQIDKFTSIHAKALYLSGKRSSWIGLTIKPAFRFIKGYFMQAGFLDGFYGFIVAINSSYSVFLKNARILEMKRNESRRP